MMQTHLFLPAFSSLVTFTRCYLFSSLLYVLKCFFGNTRPSAANRPGHAAAHSLIKQVDCKRRESRRTLRSTLLIKSFESWAFAPSVLSRPRVSISRRRRQLRQQLLYQLCVPMPFGRRGARAGSPPAYPPSVGLLLGFVRFQICFRQRTSFCSRTARPRCGAGALRFKVFNQAG